MGDESFFVYNVHITWSNATTTQHPKRFSQLYALHSKARMHRLADAPSLAYLVQLESQFGSSNLPDFPSKERLTSKLSRYAVAIRESTDNLTFSVSYS